MIFCPRFLANLYLVNKLVKAVTKLLLTACALLLLIQGSWAHAFVDHAEPAVGSQIHGSPTQVKIWFTEKLEPALCKLQVFEESGKDIDKGDHTVDSGNGAVTTTPFHPSTERKYRVSCC